jgi:hypothetical protein
VVHKGTMKRYSFSKGDLKEGLKLAKVTRFLIFDKKGEFAQDESTTNLAAARKSKTMEAMAKKTLSMGTAQVRCHLSMTPFHTDNMIRPPLLYSYTTHTYIHTSEHSPDLTTSKGCLMPPVRLSTSLLVARKSRETKKKKKHDPSKMGITLQAKVEPADTSLLEYPR